METNKTRIKLILHAMSWEIDYLLTYFIQLKKSKYHIPENVEITIDVTLNLSDYFKSIKKCFIIYMIEIYLFKIF